MINLFKVAGIIPDHKLNQNHLSLPSSKLPEARGSVYFFFFFDWVIYNGRCLYNCWISISSALGLLENIGSFIKTYKRLEILVQCGVTVKMACFMTWVALFERRYNETTLYVVFWSPEFSAKISRIKTLKSCHFKKGTLRSLDIFSIECVGCSETVWMATETSKTMILREGVGKRAKQYLRKCRQSLWGGPA